MLGVGSSRGDTILTPISVGPVHSVMARPHGGRRFAGLGRSSWYTSDFATLCADLIMIVDQLASIDV